MKQNELIDLFNSIEETLEERRRLGEFDANSKYVIFLLDNMKEVVAHAIDEKREQIKKEREDRERSRHSD